MSSKKEIWKTVKSNSNYKVSNLNRVRNMSGKVLTPQVYCGTAYVRLNNEGIQTRYQISKLKKEAFGSKNKKTA